MDANKSKKIWWENGVHFECQGSGKCCSSHGEFGFVYLTADDRKKMAKLLDIDLSTFLKKYCRKTDGLYHLREKKNSDCIFLKEKRCLVYRARPMQCRTWPFWPETLKSVRTWNKEVMQFCPGVGKGRLHTEEDIRSVLDLHEQWEDGLAE